MRLPPGHGKRRRVYGLVIVCLVSGVVTLVLRQRHEDEHQGLVDRARELALAETRRAVDQIEDSLARAVQVNQSLVERLALGSPHPDVLRAWIQEAMDEYPYFFGVGVAYAPHRYPHAPAPARLFAPYYAHVSGTLDWADINYDYTTGDQPWFQKPMDQRRPIWQEPRLGRRSQTRLASYTAPFSAADGLDDGHAAPSGVVFTTLSTAYYRALLHKLDLGKYGYGFIVSRGGLFVAHPDPAYVDSGKTIAEVSAELGDPTLRAIWDRVQPGTPGHHAYRDPHSGRSAWLLHQPIPISGWTLVVVFSHGEVNDSSHLRGRIGIFISGVIFALSAGFLLCVLLPWSGRVMACLLAVHVTAVFFVAALSVLYVVRAHVPALGDHLVELVDPAIATDQVIKLAEPRASRDPGERAPIVVPTGVFIQSIRFSDAHDVEVTGYIWQRYDDASAGVIRGIVLPEAVALDLTEDIAGDDSGLVRWTFAATLRQRFDYRYYPFDFKTVWARIQPRDLSGRVLLVPDFSAYPFVAPHFLPGLQPSIVTSELEPVKTVYCAAMHRYNSNLGAAQAPYIVQPELSFNMLFRRRYMQSVITYFVPLLVVILLVFSVLIAITTDDKQNSLFGFSFFNVLAICASLFFVVSVSHIDLRATVPQNICYAEKFYFLMYPLLLWLVLHTMLVARRVSAVDARLAGRRARLYFWPVVSFLVFVMTVWEFRDLL